MRNEKKLAFQERRIIELENLVRDLEAENNIMAQEIEYKKKALIAKEDTIAMLVKESDEIRMDYLASLEEIRTMKVDLANAIEQVKVLRKKYTKTAEAFINRIKKQA